MYINQENNINLVLDKILVFITKVGFDNPDYEILMGGDSNARVGGGDLYEWKRIFEDLTCFPTEKTKIKKSLQGDVVWIILLTKVA